VQLPRDALALGLDREPFRALLLGAQAAQEVGGVGERERHDDRDHQVRRDRLDADRAAQRARVELGGDRDGEVRGGEAARPQHGGAEAQRGRGQHERRERVDVERAAPVAGQPHER
jgi:hypothetical protein